MSMRLSAIVVVSGLCWSASVFANEVQTPAPVAPEEPVAPTSEPAPPAAQGLVIHEIPPPPPNYDTTTTAEPVTAPTPVTPTPVTPTTPERSTFTPQVAAQGAERARDPSYHAHDGFFFRATLGIAGVTAFEEIDGTEVTFGGLGVPLTLAIGGLVADNLALYGELQTLSLPEPSVRIDDEAVGGIDRVQATALAIGGSYYVMPINLYVGASVGFGSVDLFRSESSDRADGSTGLGAAWRVVVGKEWWAGSEWGLGVVAHAMLMSLPDGENNTLTLLSVGVSASATYN